jgi:hypothetical protein
MSLIDTNKLLTDRKYRTLLCEYHGLIAYIANKLNSYSKIQCAGVQFHKSSDLYELKDELIQMLKDTFPHFEIYLETYSEHYDLDENEFNICVSWKEYCHDK